MTVILIFGVVAITLLLLIFYLSNRSNSIDDELEYLDKEILDREKRLEQLDTQIENTTIDNTVNLTKAEISVLNLYDLSGIRIPADIIEDMHNLRLAEEKDILDYIENQRHYWKLENSKKVYKGVKP